MDYCVRAITTDGYVRAFAATTKELTETARQIHDTYPVVSAALGRTMAAAIMMGTMLKNENDCLTLQIKSEGEIKGLLVTADSKGNVKGYPYNNIVELPTKENGKLDVGKAVGQGTLSVIKDTGVKEPYIGQVPLVSGEIGEDITYYFAKSEQIPSAVALGVLVDVDYSIKQAGGIIIQLMPGAPSSVIDFVEDKINNLTQITTLFESGKTPEDILNDIFEGKIEISEKREVFFSCNCSRSRVEKVLISIGKKDLLEILEQDKKAELQCHFCNKKYTFDEAHIKRLVEDI